MKQVPKTFKATLDGEAQEIQVQLQQIESPEDVNSLEMDDITKALNQSMLRNVRSELSRVSKLEGATVESVTAAVSAKAAKFAVYAPSSGGRGASNNATQRDAADALKQLEEQAGRKISKDEYSDFITKFAEGLGA